MECYNVTITYWKDIILLDWIIVSVSPSAGRHVAHGSIFYTLCAAQDWSMLSPPTEEVYWALHLIPSILGGQHSMNSLRVEPAHGLRTGPHSNRKG